MTPHTQLFLLILLISHTYSFNILAIVSLPLRSHYMAFQTLFKELAIRGHNVTVINNYPDENAPPNLQFVNVNAGNNNAGYMTPLNFYETYDSTYLHLLNFYKHIAYNPTSTENDCENFFNNENVKAHYAKGLKYDVIFVEMFLGECGLAYAGSMYDAPIIGITSHVMLPTAYPRLGIPFDISSDAYYFSKSGPNPSLYHKVEIFLMNLIFNKISKWYTHSIIYEVFDKYLPNNNLDIEKVAKERMKMMFAYQHFSLTGGRLLSPQVLEIAGIHIAKPKPVPKEIEEFLSDAKDGAILVSFGSNLKANTMTPEKRQEFLNAFNSIPQKVIWKYENNTLPGVYDKVFTSIWLPQLDILCHPKVLAFVSHGGMLSLSEATHCGKPLITVPFFGDQFSNAAAAEHVGIGKVLHFEKLTAKSLASAIRDLLTPQMQDNAKRISKQWHDRPMPILDSAIFWTEYVARHGGDSPPSVPSKQSTWYESLLLDVAVVLLIITLVLFSIIVVISKLIRFVLVNIIGRLLCNKKSKKE